MTPTDLRVLAAAILLVLVGVVLGLGAAVLRWDHVPAMPEPVPAAAPWS